MFQIADNPHVADFQFSFGLDPSFAIPVPLEEPPAVASYQNNNNTAISNPATQPNDPFFNLDNSSYAFASAQSKLLDEEDQRAFSQFLDDFFMDSSLQLDHAAQAAAAMPEQDIVVPSHRHLGGSSFYSSTLPASTTENNSNKFVMDTDEDEERRRNSILRSLDEQKRIHQRELTMTEPPPSPWPSSSVTSKRERKRSADTLEEREGKKRTMQERRNRPHKELLTTEEKRANHIASEQKRRSTIRTGFKDLTEIIPTLKNMNNSKSAVLFKAVDYIRYLEKRNRGLRDKLHTLTVRVQLQDTGPHHMTSSSELSKGLIRTQAHRITSAPSHASPPPSVHSSYTTSSSIPSQRYQPQQPQQQSMSQTAKSALATHRTQQLHLLQLQEQLQQQQQRQFGSTYPTKPEYPPSFSPPRPSSRGFRSVHDDHYHPHTHNHNHNHPSTDSNPAPSSSATDTKANAASA